MRVNLYKFSTIRPIDRLFSIEEMVKREKRKRVLRDDTGLHQTPTYKYKEK